MTLAQRFGSESRRHWKRHFLDRISLSGSPVMVLGVGPYFFVDNA
jgi:hypothetical protein